MTIQHQQQLTDYRVEFSKWWTTEFKTVKFPSAGTVFDYCIDNVSHKFMPWSEKVPKFEFDPDMPLHVSSFFQSDLSCLIYYSISNSQLDS